LNQSNGNASDNEFYFADKKFHDTNKTNDKKENDEPAEDTDDTSMIIMPQKTMQTQNQ
jgi:hypothetical protein